MVYNCGLVGLFGQFVCGACDADAAGNSGIVGKRPPPAFRSQLVVCVWGWLVVGWALRWLIWVRWGWFRWLIGWLVWAQLVCSAVS